MSLNLASLGTMIKNHRKYKDLTTHQLADKLNVSAGFINNMENARSDVFRLELLYTMAKELDIPIEEILTSLFITKTNISKEEYTAAKDIEYENSLNEYLSLINSRFMIILSEYEDKEKAAKLIADHLIKELNLIKEIQTLK